MCCSCKIFVATLYTVTDKIYTTLTVLKFTKLEMQCHTFSVFLNSSMTAKAIS